MTGTAVVQRLFLPFVVTALALGVVPAAQQQPAFSVRLTSPVEDGFVSGPMRLVAVIEPAPVVRQIKEVVFFADARKVCTVTKPPFQCDWDAGERIVEHTVRVTAELTQGARAAATVHTNWCAAARGSTPVASRAAVSSSSRRNFSSAFRIARPRADPTRRPIPTRISRCRSGKDCRPVMLPRSIWSTPTTSPSYASGTA